MNSKDILWLKLCVDGAKNFSTCIKNQYMAIIVDANGLLEAAGYNGVPSKFKHCLDGGCPRAINNVPSGTPYDYGPGLCLAIHAEANCLLHSNVDRRRGGTMYVNGVPCFGCAKLIANSSLARIVFLQESFERTGSDEVLELLSNSKVTPFKIDLNDSNN